MPYDIELDVVIVLYCKMLKLSIDERNLDSLLSEKENGA